MPSLHPTDPSRTSLFYWLLAFGVSIVISFTSYALLRLTVQGKAITALETWRDVRTQDMSKALALLHDLHNLSDQQQHRLATLKGQTDTIENTLRFQGAQLEYIIAWDKRQGRHEEEQFHAYPR